MFNEPTVFILGAGASWHYGYPTGEALVSKVMEKADATAKFFEYSLLSQNDNLPLHVLELSKGQGAHHQTLWETALAECKRLKSGLEQVNPLVIDYYLGWNADLQNTGRLLIASVILDCEHHFQQYRRNSNRDPNVKGKDDWCRFITHQLAIHCRESKDLFRNRVSFVTFNYDVSLERALRDGLKHIKMFHEADVSQFLGGSRIVHMYGKIRHEEAAADWPVAELEKFDPAHLTEHSAPVYNAVMKRFLDAAYYASKGLRVIDPHDKGISDDQLTIARTAINEAKRVFILGYGFDEHNSERLDLRASLANDASRSDRPVAFTNFEDRGQINKRASKLFYGHPRNFPAIGYLLEGRYERSVRNTYDALAWDFDLSE